MNPYTFRLATWADKENIIQFMRTYWNARHPLIELPGFFNYYYKGENGRLNFALCFSGSVLVALAGFVPASQGPQPDIWLSLWLASKAAPGSGLELMEKIPALTQCGTMACNNIRPKTQVFYRFLGHSTGCMGHFYRLANKKAYLLAQVAHKTILPLPGGGAAQLRLLPSAQALAGCGFTPAQNANPYKDIWYISRRFFAYPGQSYRLYAASLGGAVQALLATRLIAAGGTAVLRICDYIGPPAFFARLGRAIAGLMQAANAEYADCYCTGLPEDVMQKAGFVQRQEGDENIIPNYLSPPLIQNTDYYYFTSNTTNFTMFKADGDQDRPNIPLG